MKKLLLIGIKDLKLMFRDRAALTYMLLAPFLLLAELAAPYFPPGTFNVVLGRADTGALVVSHKTPALVSITMFAMGLAALLATVQVYFRDTKSFLPYVTRIWLYTSPVLYPITFYDRLPEALQVVARLNPLYSLVGGWSDLLVRGELIPASMWISAALWSVGVLVVGALVFISRERDFAVRL